ncbi:MAG: M28 family peptidase [Phycisphaerales bacterium]|nr:M28 family peptidase [Phycisphaerales bacterium]
MLTDSPILRRVLALSLGVGTMVQTTLADTSARLATIKSDVQTLADPALQGRGPGLHGNKVAADFLERRFTELGLNPGFNIDGQPVFRQPFDAGKNASMKSARMGVYSGELDALKPEALFEHSKDFVLLGCSASSEVVGPLVFVGYSIEKGGPDGSYATYPENDAETPLAGKIALILRFEPMTKEGKSQWATKNSAWSSAAAISNKIQAAVKRGAAGIIVVCPPGADDPRCGKLDPTESTTRWFTDLNVPAALMSTEAADRLVKLCDAANPGGPRSLADLRALADAGGGRINLASHTVKLLADIDRSPRVTWNVGAMLPGRGNLIHDVVIIGAHYDHVGLGFTGGSRTDEYGVVHPGADDNASGTAGLLAVAGTLKDRYAQSGEKNLRSVLFLGFSAEEMGLIGSRFFTKSNQIPAASISAMLNLDMVGRMREETLEVSGTGTAEGFADLLKPLFDASGLTIKPSSGGRGPSDHASFYAAGIPVLHFFTGLHAEYHTPRDTADLINHDGILKASDLCANVAFALASRPERLVFSSTDRTARRPDQPAPGDGPRMAGLKVRFGISPASYAEDEQGVGVGEVFPGTSAADAGILVGDRLVRWNGQLIPDVAGWMELMAKHNPGDVVDVDIKRKAEDLTVRVTLKSRDQAPR